MNKIEMKTTPLIIIILISTIIVFVAYFYFFHGPVSLNPHDWASFGNYTGGVLMPILAAINIWIFVRLTQTINKNQIEFLKNESNRQDNRHQNDLEQQRRLIITQMRQREITQLSKTLDSSFLAKSDSLSDNQHRVSNLKNNLIKTTIEIDSFLNEKQNLFPLDQNSSAYKSLINIHKLIGEIHDQFENTNYEIKLEELLKLKHNAIQALYQFSLDNIGN